MNTWLQRFSSRVARWRTPALFVCGTLLLVYGLGKHGLLNASSELAYGAELAEVDLTGSQGERLELRRGTWHFLLVGAAASDHSLVRYLRDLRTRPELQLAELDSTVLVEGGAAETRAFAEAIGEDGPLPDVMPLHSFAAGELKRIGIEDHRTRYVLLTPDLTVAFISSFLQEKDLRLLLEKHFGRPGRRGANAKLRPGDAFRAPPALSPANTKSLLIVFTADCVSCVLENRMRTVARFQEELQRWASQEHLSIGLLFSPSFSSVDVEHKAVAVGIGFPVAVSDLPLTGLEDEYQRRSLFEEDVLALTLNRDRSVSSIESLDELLNRIGS